MLDAGDAACVHRGLVDRGRPWAGSTALRFAAVGFTNLSQDHLDFHGSMEAYLAAKASLFDGRWPRAANADDPSGGTLAAELRYGVDAPADVRAEARRSSAAAARGFTLDTPRGLARDREPRCAAAFNVDNVLCAIVARAAARPAGRGDRGRRRGRGRRRPAASRRSTPASRSR